VPLNVKGFLPSSVGHRQNFVELNPAAFGYQGCVLCHGSPNESLGWVNIIEGGGWSRAPASQRFGVLSAPWKHWEEKTQAGLEGMFIELPAEALGVVFSSAATLTGNPAGVFGIGASLDQMGSTLVKLQTGGEGQRESQMSRFFQAQGISKQESDALPVAFGVLGSFQGSPSTPSNALATQTISRGAQYGETFEEYMRYRNQGFKPAQAKYLTEPYTAQGHHFPIKQWVARDCDLNWWYVNSRFNVLKPSGISRGRFYELHYRVDPTFHYAPFPRAIGGGWTGNALGLQKYGTLGQWWYGTPFALKVAGGSVIIVGGTATAAGIILDE
jgi:hypothetical protein